MYLREKEGALLRITKVSNNQVKLVEAKSQMIYWFRVHCPKVFE